MHKYKYLWELNKDLLNCILILLKLNTSIAVKDGECIEEELTLQNSQSYYQVFSDKLGFVSNLSILDLLFNEGVDASNILSLMKNK
jgi:hypothetical protein